MVGIVAPVLLASVIGRHYFLIGCFFVTAVIASRCIVLQHLQLLAVVKGVRAKDVDDEAARMVKYERRYMVVEAEHKLLDTLQ